jgi:integrase
MPIAVVWQGGAVTRSPPATPPDLLEGSVIVGQSKTEAGTGRVVPLSETALGALKKWRAEFPEANPEHFAFCSESYGLIGKEGTFGGKVVPYKTFPDRPIGSWKSAWKSAKKNAGVECRWHDGRHTAVSRVAAGGATDGTLQDIFGWMSPEMIRRYSHVRLEAKRQAVAVLDAPKNRERSPQNSPQTVQSPQKHLAESD